MAYQFLNDIATADIAFRATGRTVENVFDAAAEAVLAAMVSDPGTVGENVTKTLDLSESSLELLLHRLLEELIFLKDAEQLLCHVRDVRIEGADQSFHLTASLKGEKINAEQHEMMSDLKAVTWHHFDLHQTADGWEGTVIIDV